MRRSTIALSAIAFLLCGLVALQFANDIRSSIQLSFADEQTQIIDEMVEKAAASLSQAPPDIPAAIGYLHYAHNYYPSGTKQTRGSRLDSIVERCRSIAEMRIIENLRTATGVDYGDDAELWIRELGDEPDTRIDRGA